MRGAVDKNPNPSIYADRGGSCVLVLAGIAALLGGIFVALQTIHLAVLVQTPLLLSDEWRVLPRYVELTTGKLTLLSFLWEDHFGHRPVLARLLFILDTKALGGTQVLPKIVSLLLCGFLVALFAMLLMRQERLPLGARLTGVGLLLLVFLPNQQIYNFAVGWNNAILTTVWFSIFALYLLVKSIEQSASGNRGIAFFVCAILSGILGTFSMANGLLVWPIMFLLCARFRNWPWAVTVVLVGAVVVTTYLAGFQRTGQLLDNLKQPGALLEYLVAFLGNPMMALDLQVSTLFGALGILLVGYHFFRENWRIDSDSPIVWFLFGVCLFVIGTAGLTSLGRLGFGAEVGLQLTNVSGGIGPLALRYYSFISPLWAAILLLGFIRLKRNSEKSSGNTYVVLDTVALVISMGMCGCAFLLGPNSDWMIQNHHERYERAATAIVAGVPDLTALKYVYVFPDIDILSSVPYLASNRLSVFHSDVDYFLYQKAHGAMHKQMSDGMLRDGKWCAGAIEDINKVTDTGPAGVKWYQISGWALDREIERPADGILFADEEGRLVGIGRMLLTRPNVGTALKLKNPQMIIHYSGYLEPGAGEFVTGYAFRADRNDLCRFGEKKIRQ